MGLKAPNHTQTPNELFDEWLPKLGLAELKVLMVIIRKTFGWHKIRDRISLSQLETLTGLERTHISKATKSLIEKGLITKLVSGVNGSQTTHYELFVEEDSNNVYQCRKDTPTSVAETLPPSVVKTPTKETITKEKERTTPTPSKGESACVISQPLESFGKFVKLEREEYLSFCKEHGELVTKDLIEQINDYLASSGKKPYKDYAAALRQWMRRRKENPQVNANSKGTTSEMDKEFAEKIINKFPRERDIKLGSNYIEFNFGPMNVPHIKFGDKSFREQILHNLRKMNLSTQGL